MTTELPKAGRGSWRVFLAAGAAVIAISSGAHGSASGSGKTHLYHDVISGAGAPSSFDHDSDGVTAHYVTFAGQSNFGLVHGAILVEYDFLRAGPDPACPAGTIRLPVIVSAGNRALTRTDSQVFLRDDAASARFCLDPSTGAFTMFLRGVFAGGLGKFAGATGTYQYTGSGNVLLTDASGAPFGGFVVETKGRLTLPNER